MVYLLIPVHGALTGLLRQFTRARQTDSWRVTGIHLAAARFVLYDVELCPLRGSMLQRPHFPRGNTPACVCFCPDFSFCRDAPCGVLVNALSTTPLIMPPP